MTDACFKQSLDIMVSEIGAVLDDCSPSIYLFGSVVLGDFRLGWSDIDIIVLPQQEISQEQAETLVGLRQRLLERFPGNPYYRLFEGGMLSLSAFLDKRKERVVYWGTSGQRIADSYAMDSFGMVELLEKGLLLRGNDVRCHMTFPSYEMLRADIIRHYQTIREHGKSGWGWLLDIARGVYTLRTGKIIAKTAAGEWALEAGICPFPDVLRIAVEVRKAPLERKGRDDLLHYAEQHGLSIQQFADVLEGEIMNATTRRNPNETH